jgi:hypothetical protein
MTHPPGERWVTLNSNAGDLAARADLNFSNALFYTG